MWIRIVLISVIAPGCLSEGTNSPDAGSEAAPFTALQATVVGRLLAVGIEDTAKQYGPILPTKSFASLDAECVEFSGDASDADGDSIPASATLTLDCSESKLGYTGTLTGTGTVADGQPNAVAWAFSVEAELYSALSGPFGGSMVTDAAGSIVASQDGIVGPFLLASALDVVTVITNVRGNETLVTEVIDWTVSYTPDLEWSAGGPVLVGDLATDGVWNVSIDEKSAEATLTTPTPLRLWPACKTRIVSGVVEASFSIAGQAATISVEWSGCGQRDVTYDR